MILFGLFSRHRSLKLKKIKSDRNVDVVMTVVIVVSFCLSCYLVLKDDSNIIDHFGF